MDPNTQKLSIYPMMINHKRFFVTGKIKVGRSIFIEKNLRILFDEVSDCESNGGILDSLTPFGGELWRF